MKIMRCPPALSPVFIATILCLLAAPGAFAQDTKAPAGQPASQTTDTAATGQGSAPAAPQPSPEILSLEKALSGNWSVAIRFEPSDEMPNGADGHGVEVWRAGPGGFTFMEEADDQMPFGRVFLTGFLWWDRAANKFRGMLCTSQNRHGCDPKGSLTDVHLSWDGKQFIVEIDSERNGKKMLFHEVFSNITPISFTQIAEQGEVGGPLKRFIIIYATRISEDSKPSHK
jgi:hypothetical protein